MAKRNKTGKNKVLSMKDKRRLYHSGILCSLGAICLCINGLLSWIGAVIYLLGLANWLVASYRSEKINVLDHSEFTLIIPTIFIWMGWGKTYTTTNSSCLIYMLVFSLILSALFVIADWCKNKHVSFTQRIGRSLLTVIFVFFLIGVPFISQTNVQLDPCDQNRYEAIVTDAERKTSTKSTSYYADVSYNNHEGQSQQKKIRINRSQYQQIETGQNVIVIEGGGLYRASYWLIDSDVHE